MSPSRSLETTCTSCAASASACRPPCRASRASSISRSNSRPTFRPSRVQFDRAALGRLRPAVRASRPRRSKPPWSGVRSGRFSTSRSRCRWSCATRMPTSRTSTPSVRHRSGRRPAASVPVEAVAEVSVDRSPNFISRENVQRKITVTGNVAGRDLGSVVDDARARRRGGAAASWLSRRVQRTVREQRAGVHAAVLAQPRRGRRDVLHAGNGIPISAAGRPDHGQPAAGADRGHRRRLCVGRCPLGGLDHRAHCPAGYRCAQRDHAGVAHRAFAGTRRASRICETLSSAAPSTDSCRF